MEWLEERKGNSTINNYLDDEKKQWAISRILEDN